MAKKLLALLLCITLILSCSVSAVAAENAFSDVSESDWFYADVMKVYEAGYMSGTDSTHFSPNESLTRAMIVTILWRVEGSPEGYTCNFSDVKAGTWYYKGVAWAQSTGIVSGVGDGKYAPNQTLTREQMATIVYRYAQKKLNAQKTDFDFSAYSDANTISSYAKEGVSWLMAQGALHCENNKVQPKEPAKRAEVAAGAALFIKGADPQPGPSDGKSAYEIAVENGFEGTVEEWLESLVGEDGKSAYEIAVASGYTGTEEEWLASLVGATGEAGQDGADGKSAYDLAVENGYTGTVQEWLASLAGDGKNGADGKSAYEIAVANGYVGTEVEWLRSLAGKDGKSAYEIAVDHGYTGTEVEWLASLVGEAGAAGNNGQSAYELAVANGYTGTETEWLATLVGPSGANGKNGTNGKDGTNGKSAYELAVELGYTGDLASWLDSLRGTNGTNGVDGKSAYEIAVDNGFTGTETEWLASLVGPCGANGKNGTNGTNGVDGKSAYEIAVDNGFAGSETEWLASLVGPSGANGKNGTNGKNGKDGANGVGVANAYVNDQVHLILVLTDGTEIDAGYVGVEITTPASAFTVTFKDYDGTVLKTEQVDKGKSATPPADPSRDGYVFSGWSGNYTNVQKDETVTATYTQITGPMIVVNNTSVKAGVKTVTVTISLLNNPGISSLKIGVGYDSRLTLTNVTFDEAYGAYVTAPQPFANPETISLVSPLADINASGTFATLTFTIADGVAAGTNLPITVTFDAENTFNVDFDDVVFGVINGKVSITEA